MTPTVSYIALYTCGHRQGWRVREYMPHPGTLAYCLRCEKTVWVKIIGTIPLPRTPHKKGCATT